MRGKASEVEEFPDYGSQRIVCRFVLCKKLPLLAQYENGVWVSLGFVQRRWMEMCDIVQYYDGGYPDDFPHWEALGWPTEGEFQE